MNIIFKILAYLFDALVKTSFFIAGQAWNLIKWCFQNKRKALERLWGATLVFGIVFLLSSVRFGTEVCDGSGGQMTIDPDGFVARHLIARCAEANGDLSFDLQPPSEFKWTIPKHVLKGEYNEYQYHWTDYAWNKWHDKEFLYMLASENGLFNHDRQSLVPGEPSFGFCQIHRGYHPEIVNDPRFFSDPAWQMDQCYRLFKGGTVFYGYVRFKNGGEFARARKALFDV